jgi:hypothetical protein
MTDTIEIGSGTDVEEMKIVVNALHLSLAFLLDQIEKLGGKDAAITPREALIENLSNGNIDMAIMEDRKTFGFVLSVAEALPVPK